MRPRNLTIFGTGLALGLTLGLAGAWLVEQTVKDYPAAGVAASAAPLLGGRGVDPLEDAWLATKVRASLLQEDMLNGLDIQVRSDGGIVRLSGYVNTARQAGRAGRAASAVSGVRQLRNELRLRNWTRPGVWHGAGGWARLTRTEAGGEGARQAMGLAMGMKAAHIDPRQGLWMATLLSLAASRAPAVPTLAGAGGEQMAVVARRQDAAGGAFSPGDKIVGARRQAPQPLPL